ncbi:PaaI family thioesterase [Halocynthiibacter styelae]|uniref:PaaI family thioesterase n=1 Tax=Halocynthiibacter styelae TaxID=2761955 RepID=A0A8J7IEC0_9RHOB|nr:PaaI family thioesterase [Paenihalocynthiibacter styelae]MBI1493362.1 PaaI family thioesterase [Paenihalocynthiibacter styelae]
MPPFIAPSPAEMPTPDDLMTRSGLAFMQDILAGKLSGPPIGQTMGFHLHAVENGRVVFRGTPEFNVTNPMSTVHGGWYGTILDSCMACAVMTKVPKGSIYTTLEYKININRGIPPGTEVEAIGEVQHAGRSTGISRGELRGVKDGKLYATGSTTCIIMKA